MDLQAGGTSPYSGATPSPSKPVQLPPAHDPSVSAGAARPFSGATPSPIGELPLMPTSHPEIETGPRPRPVAQPT